MKRIGLQNVHQYVVAGIASYVMIMFKCLRCLNVLCCRSSYVQDSSEDDGLVRPAHSHHSTPSHRSSWWWWWYGWWWLWWWWWSNDYDDDSDDVLKHESYWWWKKNTILMILVCVWIYSFCLLKRGNIVEICCETILTKFEKFSRLL